MAKTVVGLFEDFPTAQRAVQDLVAGGFAREDISIAAHEADKEYLPAADSEEWSGTATGATAGAAIGGIGGLLVGLGALAIPGVGPIVAAGPLLAALTGAGIGAVAGGLIGALTDIGVPEEEAGYYTEGVRRGGTLVTVRADESQVDRAVEILERHGAIDVEQRAATWRQSGWTSYSPTAGPYTADKVRQEREFYRSTPTRERPDAEVSSVRPAQTYRRDVLAPSQEKEAVLPVVEEQVQIGKRAVQRGGVRAYTRVTERPVEESVQLHEERVSVERRPVNRPLTAADTEAFTEGSIEMKETAEEAVVAKQARVVEEVVVRKEADERTEKVRDTVRRTEVQVEQLDAEQRRGESGFEGYTTDFRDNFTRTYGSKGKGYTYEQYLPAYRYGYGLLNEPRYSGKAWAVIEPEVRSDWERRYASQGKWDEMKDAVRYAWERRQGRISPSAATHAMSSSATNLIRADHRTVDHLYQRYSSLRGQSADKRAVAEQICQELEVHATLEEGIFYPAVQAKLGEKGQDLVSEALKEHQEMKRLIGQLRAGEWEANAWEKTLQTLMQGVQHHVREEESEMLPRAEQRLAGELDRLGAQMQQKKHELQRALPMTDKPGQGTLAQRLTPVDQDTNGASQIEESIEVNVPVHTAYNQWTQFEEFPRFMEGIQQVTQLDATHLHWGATIGGKEKEWDAVITEQLPDERIAWTNTTGTRNAGVVTFHRLAENKTRIMLQLAYDPEGVMENVGDAVGVVSSRVRGDLQRFKEFIEARGRETGAWRGSVEQPHK